MKSLSISLSGSSPLVYSKFLFNSLSEFIFLIFLICFKCIFCLFGLGIFYLIFYSLLVMLGSITCQFICLKNLTYTCYIVKIMRNTSKLLQIFFTHRL